MRRVAWSNERRQLTLDAGVKLPVGHNLGPASTATCHRPR